MSERVVSTAVSDFVLAGFSFYAAYNVHGNSEYAVLGFLCVACAASFGVLKFGVVFPKVHSKVIRLHAFFTWMASVIGRTATICIFENLYIGYAKLKVLLLEKVY